MKKFRAHLGDIVKISNSTQKFKKSDFKRGINSKYFPKTKKN